MEWYSTKICRDPQKICEICTRQHPLQMPIGYFENRAKGFHAVKCRRTLGWLERIALICFTSTSPSIHQLAPANTLLQGTLHGIKRFVIRVFFFWHVNSFCGRGTILELVISLYCFRTPLAALHSNENSKRTSPDN